MSFTGDLVEVGDSGDFQLEFQECELDIPMFAGLYDNFKHYFKTHTETVYDTWSIIKDIEDKVSMRDYHVRPDGWRYWLNDREGAIVVPLSDIPSSQEIIYTLYGHTICGLEPIPAKYNNYVRKHDLNYIVGENDYENAVKLFNKKHHIHQYEFNDKLILANSF